MKIYLLRCNRIAWLLCFGMLLALRAGTDAVLCSVVLIDLILMILLCRSERPATRKSPMPSGSSRTAQNRFVWRKVHKGSLKELQARTSRLNRSGTSLLPCSRQKPGNHSSSVQMPNLGLTAIQRCSQNRLERRRIDERNPRDTRVA